MSLSQQFLEYGQNGKIEQFALRDGSAQVAAAAAGELLPRFPPLRAVHGQRFRVIVGSDRGDVRRAKHMGQVCIEPAGRPCDVHAPSALSLRNGAMHS